MHKRYTRATSVFVLLFILWPTSALAVQAQAVADPDTAIENGWYYTQTGEDTGRGFAITDNGGIAFWTGFQQLGGVAELGYPVSGRFLLDGFVYQATQKVLLQWDAANGTVNVANTFDILSAANYDDWLVVFRQIPKSFDWSADDPVNDWPGTVQNHLDGIFAAQPGDTPEMVAARAALQERFLSNPNWLVLSGLPLSIQEFGPMVVMRAQRAALQYWKVSMPWANAGDVTAVLGGDIAKEAGLIPASAAQPMDAATAARDAVAPPSAALPPAANPPAPPPQPVAPGLPVTRIATGDTADQLTIVGPVNVIVSPHGNLRAYVRLQNTANVSVSTAIDVLALAEDGSAIGLASGAVSNLPPGSTRAVRLISSDPFAQPASVELRFSGTLVGSNNLEHIISLSPAQYTREGALHVLRGSVTNSGSRPYSLDLGGAFLDAGGAVTGMATGLVSNLLPGETREYTLTTDEDLPVGVSHTVATNVIVPR